VVVCGHAAAFGARYAPTSSVRIAGVFGGNLNNTGETITLTDKTGAVIWSFAYDNGLPWPQNLNGSSIVFNNATSKPAPDPAIGTNWRASAPTGGAPGREDSVPLALAPAADDDGDGVPNLLEYIMGSDPLNGASVASPTAVIDPNVPAAGAGVLFEIPRNLAADGYVMAFETSPDLKTWHRQETGLVFHGSRRDAVGRQIEAWATPGPGVASAVPLFFRLAAEPK